MDFEGSSRPDSLVSVSVNGSARPLPDADHAKLLRAVVDHRLHAPTMIELTFLDDSGDFLTRSGITFGTAIEVRTVAVEGRPAMHLGSGEVTALEGDYYDMSTITVVRAYDEGHRLQRRSRTRTFVNMSDAEIARRIVQEAGLQTDRIEPTRTRHTHLAQMNQTDWEFLAWRCREIGFECGFEQGAFYFRPATSTSAAPPVATLELQRNLRSFRPRVTAANLPDSAEVRVWDPLRAEAVSVVGPVTEKTVDLTGASAARTADAVGKTRPQPARPVTGTFGPAPDQRARVLSDSAPAQGTAIGAASQEALQGTLRQMADSFAEAQATAWGDPALRAGVTVQVASAPAPFSGLWTVAAAQHVYDVSDRGYTTRLQLGTARDRTFAGLAARGSEAPAPRTTGLLCGIVTDAHDPTGTGRVKVALPLLSPDLETDWAPVVQPAGGRRAGALMLPEVGDQVLVGFELGDTRRPYVVGGVLTTASRYRLGGPAVEATGASADVVRRGIVSPSGNMLAFHDKMPADGRPPTASEIVLGTADGSLGFAVDQVAGTVTVSCRPHPPLSKAGAGSLVIECGDAGNIDIRAGQGGRVTVDGGSALRLTARESVRIESGGTVTVKGSRIELN
ncbi:VgrG-related protein [Streptomyces sp. NPDC093223]|uniref:VgrG-related protein n=1 Tax=Streptomyces sp. NPDC093223 TaxID=3366033 RepID=UPI0037F6D355